MKYALLMAGFVLVEILLALDGEVVIHDPSTVVLCDGKYYTYGTGGSSLVSDDGWTWHRGTTLPRRGLAPDVIHLGDRYYVYVAANIGAQPKAAVNMIWSKTLDPIRPTISGKKVAWSRHRMASKTPTPSIPASFSIPTMAGCGWSTVPISVISGLVELDPKTGKRLNPGDKPRNLAINCEASDMMYHDGWYYLLATHGSCCRGADSGYNIRMGRSRKVTGPFLDDDGIDMILGGGKLLIGSGGRVIGPGHFGLLDLGQGVQKFSMHWEADLDRGGASVLDIRPLLWKDGWPVAGENLKEGTYEIESVRTGTALELAVEGMPVGGPRRRGPRPPATGPGGNRRTRRNVRWHRWLIPPQDVAQVSAKWPAGNVDARMANYLCQAQQKWALHPSPTLAAIPDRRISRSPSPARTAHWPPLLMPNCSCPPRSPARPNNYGAWISLPMAPGESCPSRSQFQNATGSFGCGQQFRNPLQIRSRERQAALAVQDAVTANGIRPTMKSLRKYNPLSPQSSPHPLFCARGGDSASCVADALLSPPPVKSARRRRLHPALAAPGAHPRQRTHRKRCPGEVEKEYFPDQFTVIPHDGDKVTVGDAELTWHAVDTKLYNVNLYHFAHALGKPTTDVLFWAVTIVNCPREMPDVRLAIGSNAASVWWVNGKRGHRHLRRSPNGDRRWRFQTSHASKGTKYRARRYRERRRSHRLLRSLSRFCRPSAQRVHRDSDAAKGRCQMMLRSSAILFALLAVAPVDFAQRAPIVQQLTFAPFHASGIYDIGETVGWTVTPGP